MIQTEPPGPSLLPEKILVPAAHKKLPRLGHTIQVGAFSRIENTLRLVDSLAKQGVTPYYFRHRSGLFKVRFGNFSTYTEALHKAEHLLQQGIIEDFYIVPPESYPVAREQDPDNSYLRQEIINTATDFIGIPYKWGGASATRGFDCSGLTMAVYRLNGLNLPRTSRNQFHSGRPVGKKELKNGDLVFFATNGGKRVSHVGIYTGNNSFIHAPSKGKKIQTTSLSNGYFNKRYVGGRSYL